MERTYTTDLPKRAGEKVHLAGWVHRRRVLKNVTFLVLRDARGTAQIVVNEPDILSKISDVTEESVVEIDGQAVANPHAPGGVEVINPEIRILSEAVSPLPFEIFRPNLDVSLPVQLDYASLALRHPRRQAIFRLAAASVAGFREALTSEGFTEVHTPKIVASSTESGANVFGIDYFGSRAYLAQSPQFYKQTLVGVFERVFEVAPVFRAEPHDTARHLAEYVSLDAEMGFIEDHHTVMKMVSLAVRHMVEKVSATDPDESILADQTLPRIPEKIPSVHFSDAQEMIQRATGEQVIGEPDLAPAHERWLGEWALHEFGSDFLFVTGYPMRKRPFYTHPDPTRPEFSNSFDLLFRGLELVTGGQRLHRYTDYVQAITSRGEDPEKYRAYIDTFRYGMPPHGGFALGLERWTARLTGAANVREVTLFPRDLHRLTP